MTSFQELKNFIENEPNILQQYVNVQSGGGGAYCMALGLHFFGM